MKTMRQNYSIVTKEMSMVNLLVPAPDSNVRLMPEVIPDFFGQGTWVVRTSVEPLHNKAFSAFALLYIFANKDGPAVTDAPLIPKNGLAWSQFNSLLNRFYWRICLPVVERLDRGSVATQQLQYHLHNSGIGQGMNWLYQREHRRMHTRSMQEWWDANVEHKCALMYRWLQFLQKLLDIFFSLSVRYPYPAVKATIKYLHL